VGAPSSSAEACASIERTNIGRFTDYTAQLELPGVLSEFSCNDINPDNAQIVDLMAQTFTSWTAWAYYPRNHGSDCPAQGLLLDAAQPASQLNAKQEKTRRARRAVRPCHCRHARSRDLRPRRSHLRALLPQRAGAGRSTAPPCPDGGLRLAACVPRRLRRQRAPRPRPFSRQRPLAPVERRIERGRVGDDHASRLKRQRVNERWSGESSARVSHRHRRTSNARPHRHSGVPRTTRKEAGRCRD
jgi:hypothetical protein